MAIMVAFIQKNKLKSQGLLLSLFVFSWASLNERPFKKTISFYVCFF